MIATAWSWPLYVNLTHFEVDDVMTTQTCTPTAELSRRIADLRRDVEELTRSVKTIAREKFNAVRTSAAEYCEERRAQAQGWERASEKCIAERPLSALLTAQEPAFWSA